MIACGINQSKKGMSHINKILCHFKGMHELNRLVTGETLY